MTSIKIHSIEKMSTMYARDAQTFERNQITKHSSKLQFTFNLLEKINEWIEIECIDGHKHKEIIQVIDRNGEKALCSCKEFCQKQMSYCIHIAALDNILYRSTQWRYGKDLKVDYDKFTEELAKFLREYNDQLRNIPRFFKTNASYYDSEKMEVKYFNQKEDAIKLVSQVTHESLIIENKINDIVVDKNLFKDLLHGIQLYDYQEDNLYKMLMAKRCVLAMSVGSGKTLTTIAAYVYLLKDNPNLSMIVFSPKSLKLQWGEEVKRATSKPEIFQIKSEKDLIRFKEWDGAKVGILTYQFSNRNSKVLSEIAVDVFVLDEIQYIRNSETKTWVTAKSLKSEYFFGLSGTVIENKIDDLYNIMQIVDPGLFGPEWKFYSTFCEIKSITRVKILYGKTRNVPKLKHVIADKVFSYDKKFDVKMNLNKNYVTMGTLQKQQHDKYYDEAKKLIAKSLSQEITHSERLMIQANLLKARQACNSLELLDSTCDAPSQKVLHLLSLIDKICIKENKKIVVFSEWVVMLKIIRRHYLQRYPHLNSVLYTGECSVKQRAESLKTFQEDCACRVFFSSDAGGVGLDGLQLASSTIIHMELPWNPARLDQRNGRVNRLLQENDVEIYYLITSDSIETSIEKLIDSKREIRLETLY